jgi:hypothetical protein
MLQHDVLGRINDYNFALNISVCLVLVESTSNQQEVCHLQPQKKSTSVHSLNDKLHKK